MKKKLLITMLASTMVLGACGNQANDKNTDTKVEEKTSDIFDKTGEPVLVTLGAKGTYLYDDHGGRIISSDKVENVVNTIGAGDTHCGGVIAGLLNGNSFAEVCKIGNNLSAQVIQQEAGSLI